MTEKQWLKTSEIHEMREHFGKKINDRKFRLYLVVCARRVKHLLQNPTHAEAIDIAEKYADGQVADRIRLRTRKSLAEQIPQGVPLSVRNAFVILYYLQEKTAASVVTLNESAGILARHASEKGDTDDKSVYKSVRARELKHDAKVFRDIFANPFRPVAFDPDWRTSTAVAIAKSAYDSLEFGNLPVLADALQDAGCENADILDHLRGPGPHVRGCWVVDLVLGKA